MSNFTPGPWRHYVTNGSPTHGIHMIAGAKPGYLAEVRDCGSGCVEANARLIAAAPDLLEALESVLDSIGALTKRHELYGHMSEKEADQVFAAIAKARGEA